MKKIIFTMVALSILPASAFKLPRGLFSVSQLEEAKVAASEKPELIGILISDQKMKRG